jgi:hypothetical protein
MTAFEVQIVQVVSQAEKTENFYFFSQKSKNGIQPTTTTVLLHVVSFSSRLVSALGRCYWGAVQGNQCFKSFCLLFC